MQLNCWSFRCSWSIACRRCSNYIFILNLTPGFNGLGKDNYKMRQAAFKFWDWVRLILETLRYIQINVRWTSSQTKTYWYKNKFLRTKHKGWHFEVISWADLAPVPLSIFRSNSKFDENSERSSFKYIRPITTIFCTRHDSDACKISLWSAAYILH